MKTRALLFGVGAIGAGIGRLAAERDVIELAGAVDASPDLAGRPLFEVLGAPPTPPAAGSRVAGRGSREVLIYADAEEALARVQPQVVLHATGSWLPDVMAQLLMCVRAGANVVSTCEELSYPWRRHPELAKQLDAEAQAHGVTLLGTGINPGFVMDTLVVALSGVCQRVERVRLTRVVDVSTRREQLQRKVGVGLTVEDFKQRVATGRFGHVGLQESCWLIAEALGWHLDSLDEKIEPFVAGGPDAAGMHQTCIGTSGGRTVIEATVHMSAGAERPRDEIDIDGTPPVHMVIEGGVPGDSATASVIVNAVPRVVEHAPGLITMLDLPVVAGRGV